jgi:hypothetical protein
MTRESGNTVRHRLTIVLSARGNGCVDRRCRRSHVIGRWLETTFTSCRPTISAGYPAANGLIPLLW